MAVPGPASGGQQALGSLQLGGLSSVDVSDLTGGGGGAIVGTGSGGLRPLGMLPIGKGGGGGGGGSGRGSSDVAAGGAASKPMSFVVLPVVLQGQGSSNKEDTVYDDQVPTRKFSYYPSYIPT